MTFLSAKASRADKHPLENPYDLLLMFIAIPGVVFITILVWAAT